MRLTPHPSSPAPRRGRRTLAAGVSLGLAASVLAVAPAVGDPVYTAVPVANPDLSLNCGLDVVLALDSSWSIPTPADVRAAGTALLSSFRDTNTRVGVITFSTAATVRAPLTLATSASTAPSGVLGQAVNAYRLDGETNWQDALLASNQVFAAATPRAVKKLLIFISDGAPRNYNTVSGPSGLVPEGDPLAVDPAVEAANAFKTGGGHVLAVGVGVSAAEAAKVDALKRISQFTDPQVSPDTAFDAATTDVILQPDFTALAADMSGVVSQVCAGSLSVTETAGSSAAPTTYGNGGAGWSVAATVAAPGDWVTPIASAGAATATETTDAGGTSLFQWRPAAPGPWSKTVTFTSTKANYAVASATCTRNGVAIPGVTHTGNAVTVPSGVNADDTVACTVRNTWTGPLDSHATLTPSAKNVVYTHSTITLSGKLTGPLGALAAQKVALQSKPVTGGTWSTVRTLTTSAAGAYTATVTPTANTLYRATYDGKVTARAHTATTSATSQVLVGTAVYVKVSKASVRKGTKVTFSGRVAPAKKGAQVLLQRKVGSVWKTMASTTLSSTSTYSLRYKVTSRTDYRWRVFRAADTTNAASYSGSLLLVVH